jgi:hypothetical protein
LSGLKSGTASPQVVITPYVVVSMIFSENRFALLGIML